MHGPYKIKFGIYVHNSKGNGLNLTGIGNFSVGVNESTILVGKLNKYRLFLVCLIV
jgi:hypothetical protein